MTLDVFLKELMEELSMITQPYDKVEVVSFDMYGEIEPIKQIHLSGPENTFVNIWHEK